MFPESFHRRLGLVRRDFAGGCGGHGLLPVLRGRTRFAGGQLAGKMFGKNDLAVAQRYRLAQRVGKFADIARPVVLAQQIEDFLREGEGRVELLDEISGQHWNVLRPGTQWRDDQLDHVETVKKVFAKLPPQHGLFQVDVGR